MADRTYTDFINSGEADLKWTNGFDLQNPDTMGTLGWDDATRTASIAVTTGQTEFVFWAGGKKFSKIATESIVIPDVSGSYYVYYDTSGVLQYVDATSPTAAMFHEYALVGLARWNATQGAGGFGNERHGIRMSGSTHMYDHMTVGARYESGIDIEGLADGVATYTQTTSGYFWDEDIRHTVAAETTHPFLYRSGPDGEWTTATADNYIGYNAGSGDYKWNEYVESGTVTDESFTSAFDTPVQLDWKYIDSGVTPVVTTTDGATTYTEGTDYTIDYDNGKITVLSTGTMADATEYYIDYTHRAQWILSEATSTTDYFMTFFTATPSIGAHQVMKVIGHAAYASRSAARAAIEAEINNLKLEGLPSPEMLFLYAVIVRRTGVLEDLADGSTYYDLRSFKGGSPSSSNATPMAADIQTDTTNFEGVLDSTHTNVQLAIEALMAGVNSSLRVE